LIPLSGALFDPPSAGTAQHPRDADGEHRAHERPDD
jgi:hypothetical protein